MIEDLLFKIGQAAASAALDAAVPILEKALRDLEDAATAKAAQAIDHVVDVLEDAKFQKGKS